ncbi:hypothetical protein GOHSU_17_00390 [Gordonia hirsuta DSM 44140 = NBRC 16056]|uniref:DUF3515 domain-containing protein n=1 Tax=Gordonia hirsuta DSM 44140 = NBRC 16056 TaxID=1121927 RepID=L7L7V2_9ACTN|nr:DUF3515 domain-containing protein [Gordonia hirsuta]GAC57235.1 hypothetical protein GOHSU_17_00390 [Gordonia hirsuta DSM 44140 = NBRC 16056]
MSESEPAPTPPADSEPYRLSPALIATLATIPTMVIIGFIVFAMLKTKEAEKIPVDSYATSTEAAERCGPLIAQLPESFGEYGGKSVEGNTVRWTSSENEQSPDPLVFRCGVARPEALAPTSSLQVINNEQWFMTDTDESRGQAYVLVDRRPYIAVWVPSGAGNGPLTKISGLAGELPSAPLDFGDN